MFRKIKAKFLENLYNDDNFINVWNGQELTKKYSNLKLVYYRFNIERMIEMGYEVVD